MDDEPPPPLDSRRVQRSPDCVGQRHPRRAVAARHDPARPVRHERPAALGAGDVHGLPRARLGHGRLVAHEPEHRAIRRQPQRLRQDRTPRAARGADAAPLRREAHRPLAARARRRVVAALPLDVRPRRRPALAPLRTVPQVPGRELHHVLLDAAQRLCPNRRRQRRLHEAARATAPVGQRVDRHRRAAVGARAEELDAGKLDGRGAHPVLEIDGALERVAPTVHEATARTSAGPAPRPSALDTPTPPGPIAPRRPGSARSACRNSPSRPPRQAHPSIPSSTDLSPRIGHPHAPRSFHTAPLGKPRQSPPGIVPAIPPSVHARVAQR